MREIVRKRSLHSKTFDLGGRRRMLRTGIRKPLHYVGESGKLEDIDITPVFNRGQYFISRAPYKVRIGRNFLGYRYTGERGTISAELVEINDNPIAEREPEYADKRFYWRGLSLGVDCTIIPRNARLDALVTLHDENAPRKFTWEILGNMQMMRPVVGRDASGRTLEIEQEWSNDRLTISWTGKVIEGKRARNGNPLTEPRYPVWIDPTVNEAIVAGVDDAFSYTGITTGLNTSSTVVLAGKSNLFQLFTGFRFQSVAIPQGTTIESATLTLDLTSIQGTPLTRIYGNDVDDAGVWADPANLIRNITKTTSFVAFSPGSTGLTEIGVTDIIQEIVNRTGWSSSNNIALGVFNQATAGGSQAWFAAAYEHATRQEAQLDIVYGGDAGNPAAHLIGL